MENSFFSQEELRGLGFASVGNAVYVSRFASFYGIGHLHLSDNVRIDDFSVISVGAESFIGSFVHVAPHVVISSSSGIKIGSYSTISSRCAIYGQSDDFSGEFLTNPTVPISLRNVLSSQVVIGSHVIIGTGSTVLPMSTISDGTAVGAMSLIRETTDSWSVYVGIPAKKIRARSKNGQHKLI